MVMIRRELPRTSVAGQRWVAPRAPSDGVVDRLLSRQLWTREIEPTPGLELRAVPARRNSAAALEPTNPFGYVVELAEVVDYRRLTNGVFERQPAHPVHVDKTPHRRSVGGPSSGSQQ